ncbi:hypothetical protein LOK46_02425 [Methylobacterium sp. NMS14P]|uniref:hypothetical protein n=1 Tax=Methylobacterium sp. NMS14P TaxID=2894310 RepID=UPI0023588192|nr:hypothetical protein [Methylobacterium sp. NMS14P]WCS25714.1 hypothetical protein LOK46_02425 [Methylobacterium sp. NMS14P]
MASTLSEDTKLSPLLSTIVAQIVRGGNPQDVVRKGYSSWQVMNGLKEASAKGIISHNGERIEVTFWGLRLLQAAEAVSKRPKLEPLLHRRIDSKEKLRSYAIGRRAFDQLRNRVRA